MLLNFNLISATCLKNYDGVFEKYSEFYWTWSVASDINNDYADLARGFSSGCSLDDGYKFDDKDIRYRELNDPFFTLKLPEVNENEQKVVSFELRCWESDFDTVNVKKFYTNQAVAALFKIFENQQQNKKAVKEEFDKWLESSDLEDIFSTIFSGNAYIGGYIQVAKALYGTISIIDKIIKSNSDELIGVYRADLHISKKGGRNFYKWIWQDKTENWLTEETEIIKEPIFEEDNYKNRISTKMKFSIMKDEPII